MFDEVRVPCPNCGTIYVAQSKGGDCVLRTYDLAEAPSDVLGDLNRGSDMVCGNENCGIRFRVRLIPIVERN